MNLLASPFSPTSPQPGATEALFDAPTYTDWVRGTIRARNDRPETIALFDSSIFEPTIELFDIVRHLTNDDPSHYVSVFDGGNPFAIKAIASRYGLLPEQIIPTTGATSALAMALKALMEPGDRVLVETPGFDLLSRLAEDAGGVVEPLLRRAPTFQVDLDDLSEKLNRHTKVVLLTNLHNPSGMLMYPSHIQAIATMAARVNAVVLIDEVYADFASAVAPPGRQGLTSAGLAPNVLTASSMTKVFGLFSLKCGWLSGDAELIQRVRTEAPDGDLGISKLSHAVAAHVLEEADRFDAHWQGVLETSRPVIAEHAALMQADGLIEGKLPIFGCMYFPRVIGAKDTLALAQWLWAEHGLLVAPGEYFGSPGHIRLGFGGDPALLDEGLGRLSQALRLRR